MRIPHGTLGRMERFRGRDVARAGLLLLAAALPAALLAVVRLLPPTALRDGDAMWIEPILLGALTVAAGATTLACLVGGLRHGTVASLLGSGAAAAVAGGSVTSLAGAAGLVGALPLAGTFFVAAAVTWRTGAVVEGRGPRVGAAVGILALAEASALAMLIPATADLLDPLAGWLLGSAAVLAFAGVLAPRLAPPAVLGGLGAVALLLDRSAGLELVIGLGLLTAAHLAALRLFAEPSRPVADEADPSTLPALALHLPDAVLHFDGRLELADWNRPAARLLALDAGSRGVRLEDLLGVSIRELPAPDRATTVISGVGDLEMQLHRSGTGLTAVLREERADEDTDRLSRELRGTLEELMRARRTIDLQRDELERSATVDLLTGVASRSAILQRLRLEIAQARRYQHPVGVMLLDIDDFVGINQRHGVAGGDSLLREVALRMRLRVREADALGRAGSDGFLAVLPHTDEEGAATFAGALRRRLVQRPIMLGDELIDVTASIGVAVVRAGEDLDLDGILARVVEALDSARRAGGDRIALDRLHGLARLEERRPDDTQRRGSRAQDSGA